MSNKLTALHGSADHLRTVVEGLSPDQLRQSAYPTEWTIADTLSHIGSGAVILGQSLDNTVHGREGDPEFNQSVWDEWNAKDPDAQAADALVADRAMVDALEALDAGQRQDFHFEMGPFALDFPGFVGLRLNEHVLHTWDVEVAVDPTAVLSPEASAAVLQSLGMIVGFAGKPIGTERTVHVTTTGPDQGIAVALGADSVQMALTDPTVDPDLVLPAESFVRLVYGRLDPQHSPPTENQGTLDELRKAFPGF